MIQETLSVLAKEYEVDLLVAKELGCVCETGEDHL